MNILEFMDIIGEIGWRELLTVDKLGQQSLEPEDIKELLLSAEAQGWIIVDPNPGLGVMFDGTSDCI